MIGSISSKPCPRCGRYINWSSEFVPLMTEYHHCVGGYQLVRWDGTIVPTIYHASTFAVYARINGQEVLITTMRDVKKKEGESMTGLRTVLQRLNANTLDLDDAVELSTAADALREGYKRHQMPTPVWLDDGIRVLDRFIGDQTRDRMEMELRELAAADAADMTAGERREARAKRKAELEAKLGKAPQTTSA